MPRNRNARVPRRPGIRRRAALLAAARALLETRDINRINLSDVARVAGIPKSSAYHFYADIVDLYISLLAELDREMVEDLAAPLRARIESWQDIVAELLRRGVRFYAGNGAARQLSINPRTPPELKLRDRRNDVALGRLFESHMRARFVLPRIRHRTRVFFHAVEIADLMFSLSVLEHGIITTPMAAEALRATLGYLRNYLPERLPRAGRAGKNFHAASVPVC
jgi:AcrR family transcriptional regulator